jgi:2-polyprenyl-3-methyl-5-hydroxy-6-metoxy-1,4-benzoquinol methylase
LRQLLGRPDKFNSQINIFNYIEKNLKKDSQVLDYGCCVGDFSILFAKLGFNVTVCDLDIPTLNFAMNRFKNRDLKIKKYGIKEDLLVPKMNDIKFNFIFCRDVLEHVTNPLKILNFFYYALDSNGMIYISTMNPGEKTYINGEHLRMSVEMANTKKYKEFFNNHFSLIDGMFGMYKKINA